jgi:hypothetical protein
MITQNASHAAVRSLSGIRPTFRSTDWSEHQTALSQRKSQLHETAVCLALREQVVLAAASRKMIGDFDVARPPTIAAKRRPIQAGSDTRRRSGSVDR